MLLNDSCPCHRERKPQTIGQFIDECLADKAPELVLGMIFASLFLENSKEKQNEACPEE